MRPDDSYDSYDSRYDSAPLPRNRSARPAVVLACIGSVLGVLTILLCTPLYLLPNDQGGGQSGSFLAFMFLMLFAAGIGLAGVVLNGLAIIFSALGLRQVPAAQRRVYRVCLWFGIVVITLTLAYVGGGLIVFARKVFRPPTTTPPPAVTPALPPANAAPPRVGD
jgi:hypothetical protein